MVVHYRDDLRPDKQEDGLYFLLQSISSLDILQARQE
jgi:hypothetical protein